MEKKKNVATKTTPVKRVVKEKTVKNEVPQPRTAVRGTWATIMADQRDDRVKPKSWNDWIREKLHVNRMK